MGLLDWFQKDKGIADLSSEEIRREQGRLEIRERQAIAQIEDLDRKKQGIFRDGAAQKSQWRRRQLARRYQIASFQLQLTRGDYNRLSKELLTLSAIRRAVERREHDKDALVSMTSLVENLDLAKLLENDKISAEIYSEKLDELLTAAEGPEMSLESEVGKEGSELLDIWQKMDEGELKSMDDAMRQAEKSVTKRIEKKQEIEG